MHTSRLDLTEGPAPASDPVGASSRERRSNAADVLQLAGRLVVGLALIHAAVHPLTAHHSLVLILNAYRVLPQPLLLPLATMLPWVEIVVGTLLVVGLFARGAAIYASVLLAAFAAGLVEAHVRGLHIDCSCSLLGDPRTLISLADIAVALSLLVASVLIFRRPGGPIAIDNLPWRERWDSW